MGYLAAGALIVSTVLGGLAYADETTPSQQGPTGNVCSPESRARAETDLQRKLLEIHCRDLPPLTDDHR